VQAMGVAPHTLLAWLGPAISQEHFEVGSEVRDAFIARQAQAAEAFLAQGDGRYRADLYLLARQRLSALGITRISGGNRCTYREMEHFYSFRRDGVTGRMGTFIWLA